MLKILKTRKILKIWQFLKEFWGLPCREIWAVSKFENSYQKLNVPREQQHSNPSHDHAAKAAGKKNEKCHSISQNVKQQLQRNSWNLLHPPDPRLLLLRMALVNFFYFWFVCFRFPVTKRSTVRCVICQLRSTRGDGPWLHQTETSYPTFISTTQQSDTPPPATTETAGGKNGSQVLFGQYFLWKKRHHPSLRNCKLVNYGKLKL